MKYEMKLEDRNTKKEGRRRKKDDRRTDGCRRKEGRGRKRRKDRGGTKASDEKRITQGGGSTEGEVRVCM